MESRLEKIMEKCLFACAAVSFDELPKGDGNAMARSPDGMADAGGCFAFAVSGVNDDHSGHPTPGSAVAHTGQILLFGSVVWYPSRLTSNAPHVEQ